MSTQTPANRQQVLNQKLDDFMDYLQAAGVSVDAEQRNKIRDRLQEKFSYEPRIGVFGKTGAGKSSLCNALFGQDICKVSDVEACTRDPQEVLIKLDSQGLKMMDVPGVGENEDRDIEYARLYKQLLPELDAIFWVLKADDRAYAQDYDFYNNLVKPYMEAGKPFFIILNQVDKIEPFREWQEDKRRPGLKQQENIEKKADVVAQNFKVPRSKVIPVSANEKYNLFAVVDELIFALPKEQKVIVLNQVRPENVSEQSSRAANRGFWDTVDDVVEDLPLPEPLKQKYRQVREIGEAVWEVGRSAVSAVKDAVTNFFSGW